LLVLGLILAAIDTATLDMLSCSPFPVLPPHLFRIHIPDSMHACLVPLRSCRSTCLASLTAETLVTTALTYRCNRDRPQIIVCTEPRCPPPPLVSVVFGGGEVREHAGARRVVAVVLIGWLAGRSVWPCVVLTSRAIQSTGGRRAAEVYMLRAPRLLRFGCALPTGDKSLSSLIHNPPLPAELST
jgi:hypothetical protein